ncbi:uncharacterized protein LOC135095226 [Scylla paramamosain]|uniref:uncharacterized protein LOC135095226 n=1 Tax=Scylla paramamosain TaxID=85552 RepID=UPI0030829909
MLSKIFPGTCRREMARQQLSGRVGTSSFPGFTPPSPPPPSSRQEFPDGRLVDPTPAWTGGLGGARLRVLSPRAVFDGAPGIMSEAVTSPLPPARSLSPKTLEARSFGSCVHVVRQDLASARVSGVHVAHYISLLMMESAMCGTENTVFVVKLLATLARGGRSPSLGNARLSPPPPPPPPPPPHSHPCIHLRERDKPATTCSKLVTQHRNEESINLTKLR